MTPLEPGYLWVTRIGVWAVAGAALVISTIVNLIVAAKTDIPFGVFPGVVLVLAIYPALVAPARHFHAWGWKVEAEELWLQHGHWTRVETLVPFRRVQHIDVSQGALERAFSVCSLMLHTAGTQDFKVVLPGLSRETAERLRDEVRAVVARQANDR